MKNRPIRNRMLQNKQRWLLALLLLPLMAVAQQNATEGAPALPQPGADDHPEITAPHAGTNGLRAAQPDTLTTLEHSQLLATQLIGNSVRVRQDMALRDDREGVGPGPGVGTGQYDPATTQERPAGEYEGQQIGTIEDVILDRQGRIAGILVDVDHAAVDREDMQVALRWEIIQVQRHPEDPEAWMALADIDPPMLDEAPDFEREREEEAGQPPQ